METKTKCRYLEVKHIKDGATSLAFGFPEGHCCCLCTMGTIGPDNDIVDIQMCMAERDCYEEEV